MVLSSDGEGLALPHMSGAHFGLRLPPVFLWRSWAIRALQPNAVCDLGDFFTMRVGIECRHGRQRGNYAG
jgi:hypothetical protein